ncbi:MAG: helix-turn-helix transcriptional regulator [Firmicutes bacterium]|nr:helix-turn-helix transcriptional regulator [Bacillota bacterium]
MFIGSRLREVREKKGYSQAKLGELTGVTKVSICGYELGHKTPSAEKLDMLATVLNITTDYLLGRDQVGEYVSEEGATYHYSISKEEIKIIRELRKRNSLYHKLITDPKRTFDLIELKLNK